MELFQNVSDFEMRAIFNLVLLFGAQYKTSSVQKFSREFVKDYESRGIKNQSYVLYNTINKGLVSVFGEPPKVGPAIYPFEVML